MIASYVKCSSCGNTHRANEVRSLDIDENELGQDQVTFECPETSAVVVSLVYVDVVPSPRKIKKGLSSPTSCGTMTSLNQPQEQNQMKAQVKAAAVETNAVAAVTNAKAILERLGIDTASRLRAIQDVRTKVGADDDCGPAQKAAAEQLILDLTAQQFNGAAAIQSVMVAQCVVEAVILDHPVDLAQINDRVCKIAAANPWMFVGHEDVELPKGAASQLRPAKVEKAPKAGGAKERAIELYKANPNATAGELTKMFVDQLKLSIAGARTYSHNVRSGKWA